MSVSDVLFLGSRIPQERVESGRATGAAQRVLGAAGLVLAIVGWTDWLLLWVPLQFGVVEWEFGTISQSFDALPLATIGTAALVVAALNGGWRRTLAIAGSAALVIGVLLLLVLGVFVLDIPIVLNGVTGTMRPVLVKAMAKTSLYGLLYTSTYAWLGLTCWQAIRRAPRRK